MSDPAPEPPPKRRPPAPWATRVVLSLCVAWFLVAEAYGDTTDTLTLLRFGATERASV